VAVFGNKMEMNEKPAMPTIQLSKQSLSSHQSKAQNARLSRQSLNEAGINARAPQSMSHFSHQRPVRQSEQAPPSSGQQQPEHPKQRSSPRGQPLRIQPVKDYLPDNGEPLTEYRKNALGNEQSDDRKTEGQNTLMK